MSGHHRIADPNPVDTRRRAMQALVGADHTRYSLQAVLFPSETTDFVRAEWTGVALRWLHDHGYVRKLPSGRYWRATREGVEALHLSAVFNEGVSA